MNAWCRVFRGEIIGVNEQYIIACIRSLQSLVCRAWFADISDVERHRPTSSDPEDVVDEKT